MKIAVIGAGVSGLVCARALQADHEVVVFEAAAEPGGHAHTVHVERDDGAYALDTGFIVYNDRNYPHFERLLEELNVETQPSQMSFSVSDAAGFEYSGASPNGLFATRAHLVRPSFHRMVADLLRFNREARELLAGDEDPSLREYLDERGYSQQFIEHLIVPQVCAVWSADPEQMWSFPARFLIEFFDNHGMLGFTGRPRWRSIAGGSQAYVHALVASLDAELRTRAPVLALARSDEVVRVSTQERDGETFDAAVVATHSDEALAMLRDPSDAEREVLGAIAYQQNEVVLHTDRSLLPRRRRAWASWNYHLDAERRGCCALTYHLNRLQRLSANEEFCVTLNRTHAIDPERVIASFRYAHPVYSASALAAQARCAEISGVARTYYCGAYWGFGFHEDGVASGLRAAREVGAVRERVTVPV
jgi:predicted NAD/FAD-binding protein